jgi:hypothetical protein
VRELAERGVLVGERGSYACRTDVAEVRVPATLQATIAARIDRLGPAAKHTLSAASVIGSRFSCDLLASLGIDPFVDELITAELIDQVRFTARAEYVFRHPLIRTVAYESQLKADRARLHRRLAAAIETGEPESTDQNAALIAEHLEAAGDGHTAYGWHMRAATWATNRDIAAARVGWERAQTIADALPADDPHRAAMRIAPRTMLCVSAWRAVHANSTGHFEELRELCTAAGDKASLAIAMTGPIGELLFHGRVREASRLASEQMALLESIGDPTLTIGAAFVAINIKYETGEFADILRWSQTVVDLAEGDPTNGATFGMGSPLAGALLFRGIARYWLGRPGWRQDLDDAVATAPSSDPATHALIVTWKYGYAIPYGVLRADDSAVREIEEAVQTTEGLCDDTALGIVRFVLGFVLVHRDAPADRHRGLELLAQVRDVWLRERSLLQLVALNDVHAARERARCGSRDQAIPVMRKAVKQMLQAGRLTYGGWGIGVLVETLVDRGADGDVAEAKAAVERLEAAPTDDGLAVREIWLLRLHALLARAHGDDAAYRDYRDRYRAMATLLAFDGHIAWAEAMP